MRKPGMKFVATVMVGVASFAIQGVSLASAPNAKLGNSGFWSHEGPEWKYANGKWERADTHLSAAKVPAISTTASNDGAWVDAGGDIGYRPNVHAYSITNGKMVHNDAMNHSATAPSAPRTVSPSLVP